MIVYLDLESAVVVAARAVGAEPEIADWGLLESALARPRATAYGEDAYPTMFGKAAALLQSLAKNHCLVDGDKRLAWLATVTFCYLNGILIDAPDDDAYDFMIAVADGSRADLADLAAVLEGWSRSLPS